MTEIVREDPFVASELAEQVKTISTKPNDLSSMPRIHLLEEETQTLLAVLCSPCTAGHNVNSPCPHCIQTKMKL